MSSSTFSACLIPDPFVRIALLTSARVLAAIGFALILTMEAPAAWRFAGCLAWGGLMARELRVLQQYQEQFSEIRLHSDGMVRVRNASQEWVPARLLTGTVVLQNLAWIRLQTGQGAVGTELLYGHSRESEDWRRLQLIWRYVGAAV